MNEENKEIARYIAKKIAESTENLMDYIDERFDSLSEELHDDNDELDYDEIKDEDDLFSVEKKKYSGIRSIDNTQKEEEEKEEKENELQGESTKDSIGDERGEGVETDKGTPSQIN